MPEFKSRSISFRRVGGMAQVVECLPSKSEAQRLNSRANTLNKFLDVELLCDCV
jgi:hypothetical protein